MKNRLAITAVAALFTLTAVAAPELSALPEALRTFAASSSLMMEGIKTHDKALILNAAEGFDNSCNAELSAGDFICVEGSPGDLTNPVLRFSSNYCNELIKNDYAIVEMDEPELLRETESVVDVIRKGVTAHGKVSFTLYAVGPMNIALAASEPDALKVTVDSNGWPVLTGRTPDGVVDFASWDAGAVETPITVTIENPTDRNISFALAFQ